MKVYGKKDGTEADMVTGYCNDGFQILALSQQILLTDSSAKELRDHLDEFLEFRGWQAG